MKGIRGLVRDGRIELMGSSLPEGTEVLVLPVSKEPFDLSEAKLRELEARLEEAERGIPEPADAVLRKLRGD